MRALCMDEAVIGTSFYVMDYLEGRIFRDAMLPGMEPAERAAIYDDLNATLAKLHKVDFVAVGLGDYGKAGGYFERQVSRWTKQYRGAESERIPEMEALIAQLPGRIPIDDPISIAHGDYRLETVKVHPIDGDPDHGYFYTNDRVYIVNMNDGAIVYSPGTYKGLRQPLRALFPSAGSP
eukprot:gene11266-15154_t